MGMAKLITVILSLLLGGCGDGLTAFVSSVGALGGSYVLDTIKADARDVSEFNTKHNMRVDRVMRRCFNSADGINDWAAAKPVYMDCFKFEEDNQPAIFVERLKNRVRRAKEREQSK